MKKRFSILISILIVNFIVIPSVWSKVSEVKQSVCETRQLLENGLEIIFVENHGSPIISSNVIVKTGLSNESHEMNGVSHFLEHLLFNGTARRTQKELYDEVDFYGAYNNAFTREDYTCFQMIIASSFLEKGLDIQSDMLFHSTFPEDKFEKEKGIIIEEIGKDRGNPDYLAQLFLRERVFQKTPYSRPVLGTVKTISAMKREDVISYYKEHYVPNNMILFLFGDFDSKKAVKLIEKYFGGIPFSKIEEKAKPSITYLRKNNLYRNKMETGRNYLDILTKAPDLSSDEFFPFYILISILSQGEDSRLHIHLKGEEEHFVFQFSLDHAVYGKDGLLHFSASIPESISAKKVMEIYFKELQKVAEEGITSEELAKAKQDIKATEIYLQEQLHYYVAMRGQWLASSKPGFLKNFLRMVENQDVASVNAVARKYLMKIIPLITISGLNQENEVAEKYEVSSYRRDEVEVIAEDVKKKVLNNGMTIIVKCEDTSRIFAVHLLMKNRSFHEPEGKAGIADFTHRMLMKGTTLMDSIDLSEEMKEIGARIKIVDNAFIPYDDYYTTSQYSYIRFETLSEHYVRGLKLLKEIVFHPAFPESEISKVASEIGNIIKRNEEKVSEKAGNFFLSKVFGSSKLGNSVYGNRKTIASISRDDLLSFHQKYFSPQNIIVSIVSNIPVEKVMVRMDEIFSKIKSRHIELADAPKTWPTSKSNRFELKGGKQQSFIYAGYLFHIDEREIPALSVANAILSERMAFQLREKQGLAYRVGCSIKYYGDFGLFFASMGTRAQNLNEAVDGILDQIESFAKADFPEKEIEKTINSLIGRYAMRRISGINRAYFLGLSEFQGRGYNYDLDFINKLKTIQEDQIRKVARKYFDASKIILVIAE